MKRKYPVNGQDNKTKLTCFFFRSLSELLLVYSPSPGVLNLLVEKGFTLILIYLGHCRRPWRLWRTVEMGRRTHEFPREPDLNY